VLALLSVAAVAHLTPARVDHAPRIDGCLDDAGWAAAFAGTADQASVDGDVAMTEAQLQPTLEALRANK
jgi:hypothetical protein